VVTLWLIRFIVLEFGFKLGCLICTYIIEVAILYSVFLSQN
jgi:hypothetical protein